MGKETRVKVHESNETAELALCLWLGEVIDGLDFIRKWENSMAINVVSQEVEGVGTKQTFDGVYVGGQASKHCFQIL